MPNLEQILTLPKIYLVGESCINSLILLKTGLNPNGQCGLLDLPNNWWCKGTNQTCLKCPFYSEERPRQVMGTVGLLAASGKGEACTQAQQKLSTMGPSPWQLQMATHIASAWIEFDSVGPQYQIYRFSRAHFLNYLKYF